MNPETGAYESDEFIRAFAKMQEIDEKEAALRILGGAAVRVEGTDQEVEAMSRAIRRSHERDLDSLARLRKEIEKRERRQQR
jgi:hypothetical protein